MLLYCPPSPPISTIYPPFISPFTPFATSRLDALLLSAILQTMRKCLFLAVFCGAALCGITACAQTPSSPVALEHLDKPALAIVTPQGSQQNVYTESTPSANANVASKVIYQMVDTASDLVNSALSYMGINYHYGGNTPDTGFDCSGFVRYVYNNTLGLVLPRSSAEMSKKGDSIKKDELRPGDLVFFNTLKRAFSHVGIYIGEGKFVHAPATGGAVRVESMDIPYWQKRFNGARRMDTYTLSPSLQPASVSLTTLADTPKEDSLDKIINDLTNKAK
jgi:cell wall-associated NlpC family hydrolase